MEISKIGFLVSSILLCMCWLCFDHFLPWTSFISDLLVIIAILFSTLIVGLNKNKVPIILLPIILIALIPIIQYKMDLIYFFGISFLTFSYILLFFMAIVLAYNLKNSEVNYFEMLMCAFLISGLLSALIAIFQWLNLEKLLIIAVNSNNYRVYANFGQPNHLATFLIMSLVAGCYLYDIGRLNKIFFIFSIIFIVFASALTQSRILFIIYPTILIFWYIYRKKNFVPTLLGVYSSIIFLFFLLVIFTLPNFNDLISHSLAIQSDEIMPWSERMSSGNFRLLIWQQMLAAIAERPWVGYGWGQITYAQLDVLQHIHHFEWVISGHNFILDILVQNGIIVGLIILVYILMVLRVLLLNIIDREAFYAVIMLIPVFIHSLFEFPQTYASFLLPCGLLIGFILQKSNSLKTITIPRYSLFILAIIGFLFVKLIWTDYNSSIVELKNTGLKDLKRKISKIIYNSKDTYISKNKIIILDQFLAKSEWNYVSPFSTLSKNKIDLYKHVVDAEPSGANLYKFSQMLYYNGYKNESKLYLNYIYILYNIKIEQNILLKEYK